MFVDHIYITKHTVMPHGPLGDNLVSTKVWIYISGTVTQLIVLCVTSGTTDDHNDIHPKMLLTKKKLLSKRHIPQWTESACFYKLCGSDRLGLFFKFNCSNACDG